MRLGLLIDKLAMIADRVSKAGENPADVEVRYGFGYMRPTTLDSWRGVYAELALGYGYEAGGCSVAKLLAECRGAVGKTFHGYKGGEYRMSRDTEVWVDNYGECSGTRLDDMLARALPPLHPAREGGEQWLT